MDCRLLPRIREAAKARFGDGSAVRRFRRSPGSDARGYVLIEQAGTFLTVLWRVEHDGGIAFYNEREGDRRAAVQGYRDEDDDAPPAIGHGRRFFPVAWSKAADEGLISEEEFIRELTRHSRAENRRTIPGIPWRGDKDVPATPSQGSGIDTRAP
jgi:hypothetical protein